MERPDYSKHLPLLREMARRYVWWESPGYWDDFPEHTIAYVLRCADTGCSARVVEDQENLLVELGEEAIRFVLATAEPNLAGIFHQKAWRHWHLRLGMATADGEVPPLPQRFIPPVG
jgi:hypothetical protein